MCLLHRINRLIRFIVSKDGIHLDPLKVEAILNLLPPPYLHQLHSLQGKANFLHRFIPNYAEIAKGYTRLLKRDTPLVWDDIAKGHSSNSIHFLFLLLCCIHLTIIVIIHFI